MKEWKHIKRNRDSIAVGLNSTSCKRTQRWPYVCDGCNKKYQNCPFTKYKYVAEKAQKKADINLINSRKGIDISSEEFIKLDSLIKIKSMIIQTIKLIELTILILIIWLTYAKIQESMFGN